MIKHGYSTDYPSACEHVDSWHLHCMIFVNVYWSGMGAIQMSYYYYYYCFVHTFFVYKHNI